jgi:hypothetical protein
MHHDLVANLDVVNLGPDRPDNPRSIRPTGMEIFRLALLLTVGDDIDRVSQRRPDIVVVDAACHDIDQHIFGADLRRWQDLTLPGILRRAETVLAHGKGVHVLRHDAQLGHFSQSTDFGAILC